MYKVMKDFISQLETISEQKLYFKMEIEKQIEHNVLRIYDVA